MPEVRRGITGKTVFILCGKHCPLLLCAALRLRLMRQRAVLLRHLPLEQVNTSAAV